MPNEQLANRILDLSPGATAVERLVLKIAAGMIKMVDPDYDPEKETDVRIKIAEDEWGWLPGPMEVRNGVAGPKDWGIPSRIARSEEIEREIKGIQDREGITFSHATLKYWQSKGQMLDVTYAGGMNSSQLNCPEPTDEGS